ncbi:MAG: hypothetical protein AAGD38_00695 [Acidobacteriota bacterium]
MSRRPGPLWVAVVAFAAAVFLAAVERGVLELRGAEASWIWLDEVAATGRPVAFYAARDIDLRNAPDSARLTIAADEGYRLWVNAVPVGAGAAPTPTQADRYEVTELFDAGLNRILVEGWSSRGAGGVLLDLEIDGETALVSDDSWRLFRNWNFNLFYAFEGLEAGEPAKVWGRPPAGRWRLGSRARQRPLIPPAPPGLLPVPPMQIRNLGSTWSSLADRRRLPKVGPVMHFDWGRPVTGVLEIDLSDVEVGTALIYFGLEAPDPTVDRPDTVLVAAPDAPHWYAPYPLRFRHLLVVGIELDKPPLVIPIAADTEGEDQVLERLSAPPADQDGVFGLAPPVSWMQVEELVWDRLRGDDAEESLENRHAKPSDG